MPIHTSTTKRTGKPSNGGQKAIIVKLDREKHRNLRIYAAKHGITVAFLVRQALDKILKHEIPTIEG